MGTETSSGVGDKVDQAKETVAEQASQVSERGRNVVQEQLDQRSTRAGEQVGTAAKTLRQVAEQSRMQGDQQQARMAEQVAEQSERLSNYLVEADGERMLREAEDFARREPWMVAGFALGVGFVLARALKASSSTRYQRAYPQRYRQLPMRTPAWSSEWGSEPAGRLPHEQAPRVPGGNGDAETTRLDVGTRQ